MSEVKNNREIYLDFLRVFASIAVIFLHVAAQNWYDVRLDTFEWNTFNIYDSLVRWAVPIFVMMSGVLFLNKDKPIKEIYKKNILHIAIAFVFWSVTYSLIYHFQFNTSLKQFVLTTIKGQGHMWYLLMIIGIYMIVPFLKMIVDNEKYMKYFLILALIFAFIVPQGISIISIRYKELGAAFNNVIKNLNLHLVMGYSFYFILGYYLNKIKLSKTTNRIIYGLGILGFISTAVFTYFVSRWSNTYNALFYEYFSVTVLLESIAIFVLIKNIFVKHSISEKTKNFIYKLSKYSFGIYLVHMLIVTELKEFWINTLSFNPILSVPALTLCVLVISFIISLILNHIPVVKKYIV